MKRVFVGFLLLTMVLSCGGPAVKSSLEKGGPLYQFATDLAAKWPILDPEKNSALAESKYFTIRVDSFLIEMHAVAGKSMFDMRAWPVEQLRQTVSVNVERMAERRLLVLAARRQGVQLASAEIDSAMQRLYRQNGGEAGFTEKLKNDGLSVDLIRKNIVEELTMRRFLKKLASQEPVVSEEDIQALYQQEKTVTFQHILLVHAGVADSVYNARHKKLMDGMAAGRDFSSLAKEFSDDPHSRKNGGLYQDIPRSYWPKKLDELIFSAPLQQVQETTTDQGQHVIRVLSRDKEKRPLAEVRAALEEQVRQKKRKSQRQEYLQQLKNEAQWRPTF